MKRILSFCIMAAFIFCATACSKKQIHSVMDDISRDTYEKNMSHSRMEEIGNPNRAEPPSYDQYQKERKKMLSDPAQKQPQKKE